MPRKATARDLARWRRRATTLLRKAEELSGDMINVLGVEHEGTDYSDNVVAECETLTSVLDNRGLDMWRKEP